MTGDRLTEAVLRLIGELPRVSVERVAQEAAAAGTPSAGDRMIGVFPLADFRRLASALVSAWRDAPQVTGSELASMLRGAAAAREAAQAEGRVEVVWTGPGTVEVPRRTTEAVMLEVVGEARNTLLLVTYAAFRYAPLVDALEAAAERGVQTEVLVETRAGSGGLLSWEPSAAFAGIPDLRLLEWPPVQREAEGGRVRGRMHAKLAVADRRLAFVTSANLTGNAIEDNLECGLLVSGGTVPGRLADHVTSLLRQGVFRALKVPSSSS
ncbi:MAG: DISARM system phospholipase D-like protein DrmC [Candidatus Dormibacteraeota bacterium]|nr:DISARM system phospholipase D-like protein DrmC [Candidatus Dormibacteraeota bacterium]